RRDLYEHDIIRQLRNDRGRCCRVVGSLPHVLVKRGVERPDADLNVSLPVSPVGSAGELDVDDGSLGGGVQPLPPLVGKCGEPVTSLPRKGGILGGPLGLNLGPLVTAAECGTDDVTGDFAVAAFVDVPLIHGVDAL